MAWYGFLLLGVLGSTHCLGMCSPISTGFGAQSQNIFKIVIFNLARVFGYGIIGFLTGIIAISAQSVSMLLDIQLLFSLLSGIMTFMLGSYVLNIWNGLSFLTKVANPFWLYINSVFRKTFEFTSYYKISLAGLLWGFLPCGLVYSAAIASMELLSPTKSFFALIVFGLGTFPANVALGFFGKKAKILSKKKMFQNIAGGVLIVWGSLQIYQTLKVVSVDSSAIIKCDLSSQECSEVFHGKQMLRLNVTPKPIKALQRSEFEIQIETNEIESMSAYFEGVDMDMGYNKMDFEFGEGIWRGRYVLPICSPKEMIWRMRIFSYLKNKSKKESVFYFITKRDF